MSREETYDAVNACETTEELEKIVLDLCDEDGMIQGRTKKFDGNKMATYVKHVVNGVMSPSVLTREFGIRQQAMYLNFYE